MATFPHDFAFDPSCGMDLDDLLAVSPPIPPEDFPSFWRARWAAAVTHDPRPVLGHTATVGDHLVSDLTFRSTGGFTIGGWYVRPRVGPIERGLVVGHGYGGRVAVDLEMAFPATALLFPCLRGLGRSARPGISTDPNWHVLHDIHDRDTYVIGGCVDDLWLAVSAMIALAPETEGRIGLSGISLSGGVGALALPWESRIARAELLLPTFGHQVLRLGLPMTGSGESIRKFEARHGGVMRTLAYYDAASAAGFIDRPVLIGCALFDPAVPPPGQFAVHNALSCEKELVTFDAGHFDYPRKDEQDAFRLSRSRAFFDRL